MENLQNFRSDRFISATTVTRCASKFDRIRQETSCSAKTRISVCVCVFSRDKLSLYNTVFRAGSYFFFHGVDYEVRLALASIAPQLMAVSGVSPDSISAAILSRRISDREMTVRSFNAVSSFAGSRALLSRVSSADRFVYTLLYYTENPQARVP